MSTNFGGEKSPNRFTLFKTEICRALLVVTVLSALAWCGYYYYYTYVNVSWLPIDGAWVDYPYWNLSLQLAVLAWFLMAVLYLNFGLPKGPSYYLSSKIEGIPALYLKLLGDGGHHDTCVMIHKATPKNQSLRYLTACAKDENPHLLTQAEWKRLLLLKRATAEGLFAGLATTDDRGEVEKAAEVVAQKNQNTINLGIFAMVFFVCLLIVLVYFGVPAVVIKLAIIVVPIIALLFFVKDRMKKVLGKLVGNVGGVMLGTLIFVGGVYLFSGNTSLPSAIDPKTLFPTPTPVPVSITVEQIEMAGDEDVDLAIESGVLDDKRAEVVGELEAVGRYIQAHIEFIVVHSPEDGKVYRWQDSMAGADAYNINFDTAARKVAAFCNTGLQNPQNERYTRSFGSRLRALRSEGVIDDTIWLTADRVCDNMVSLTSDLDDYVSTLDRCASYYEAVGGDLEKITDKYGLDRCWNEAKATEAQINSVILGLNNDMNGPLSSGLVFEYLDDYAVSAQVAAGKRESVVVYDNSSTASSAAVATPTPSQSPTQVQLTATPVVCYPPASVAQMQYVGAVDNLWDVLQLQWAPAELEEVFNQSCQGAIVSFWLVDQQSGVKISQQWVVVARLQYANPQIGDSFQLFLTDQKTGQIWKMENGQKTILLLER